MISDLILMRRAQESYTRLGTFLQALATAMDGKKLRDSLRWSISNAEQIVNALRGMEENHLNMIAVQGAPYENRSELREAKEAEIARTEFKYAGSVSHGTMRTEDLVPCFCDTLEIVAGDTLSDGQKRRLREIRLRLEAQEFYHKGEDVSEDMDWLFDTLTEVAPEGYYFGAHEGDGSDYGFWCTEEDPDTGEYA